eukprot:scaffold38298_cov49-Attheya_sp.AAC.3
MGKSATNGVNNGTKETTIVPPSVVSGMKRQKGLIVSCFLSLSIVYAGIYYMYSPDRMPEGWYVAPFEKYCENHDYAKQEICSRPDLMAFQVTCALVLTYLGVMGFYLWHINKRAHTAVPNTPEGRLFGYIPESENLIAINFIFQVWDFLASIISPEHCTVIFMTHHLLAAIATGCALANQVSRQIINSRGSKNECKMRLTLSLAASFL